MPVYIPETIRVHLGAPSDTSAQNITVGFDEYIKNVASSEIYPTWPENAIRANIYAQISYALNRIYTEYYRSRGYDFDITNSTAFDQSFVYGRDIFENISEIVDDIFDEYLRRQGNVEPLFAQYCDGVRVTCSGLSQWGSVDLAEDGFTPYQIITNYYGNDIDIVSDTPVQPLENSYPGVALELGDAGNDVRLIQVWLNRVSTNYPIIPKIFPVNGVFGVSTQAAVEAFQRQFDLSVDGVVGKATWYSLKRIYTAVKRLSELQSEGVSFEETKLQFPGSISPGDSGVYVRLIQYIINVIAESNPAIPSVDEDGIFGPKTEDAVLSFKRDYGLADNSVLDAVTWNSMLNVYEGIVRSLPEYYSENGIVPFPGRILSLGIEGNGVRLLQNYINEIASVYTEIPSVEVTDIYSSETEAAVRDYQELFGLETTGIVTALVWDSIADTAEDIRSGGIRNSGQYIGYEVSQSST